MILPVFAPDLRIEAACSLGSGPRCDPRYLRNPAESQGLGSIKPWHSQSRHKIDIPAPNETECSHARPLGDWERAGHSDLAKQNRAKISYICTDTRTIPWRLLGRERSSCGPRAGLVQAQGMLNTIGGTPAPASGGEYGERVCNPLQAPGPNRKALR